jgi:4-hydroxy-tetrahydrodipicolinate synthase
MKANGTIEPDVETSARFTQRMGESWPVVLTPFKSDLSIDWDGYSRLISFYLENGASGLFAVCHSSEMDFLELDEILHLAQTAVDLVPDGIEVVASIGKCQSPDEMAARTVRLAETGVAGVILTCSSLGAAEESDDVIADRLFALAEKVHTPLGLYESPIPYHRLVGDKLLQEVADSGRFIFLKDTSANIDLIGKRMQIVEGSSLEIFSAHTSSLLEALRLNVDGYSGIGTNFFPDQFSWLVSNWQSDPSHATMVQYFLAQRECELVGGAAYPASAKQFLSLRGVPIETHCRKKTESPFQLLERHREILSEASRLEVPK